MQNLDEKEWKRISINSVFVIGHGFYNKKPPMSSEGEVPFIGASGINNGVTGFCTMQAIEDNSKVGYGPNEPIERKLFNKGSICVVNNGSAIGYSYYQPKQFTCTHDVNPLTLRDHEMNEDEALFLAQMIRQQGDCFIYARKWRPSRMVSSQFLLPVDSAGNPDYAYMAEYVQQKRAAMLDKYHKYVEARIAELGELVEIPMLDEKEWHAFHLEEIGTVTSGRDIYAAERVKGNTPYITSGGTNNGVGYFVGNINDTLDSGYIALNRNGAVGKAFYHPSKSLMGNDCRKVHLKDADRNLFVGQFVSLCLSMQSECFSYSRKLGTARAKRMQVMLPVTDSGELDYEYMEQYAKNMMLRKYQQYLEFINRQNVAEVE